MAQRVEVQLIDDLDGKDISGKGETVAFVLDGVQYEIDLSSRNAEKLRKALKPYLEAGRRVAVRDRKSVAGTRGRTGAAPDLVPAGEARRAELAAVREWARENGWTVSERGRISADVMAAFEASQR